MSDELTPVQKAQMIIDAVQSAIKNGTRHFRRSDGKELRTAREVLEALAGEGVIDLQGPQPIIYNVKVRDGEGKERSFTKTKDNDIAEFMLKEVRQYPNIKAAWVDLETPDGEPHPCLMVTNNSARA